MSEVELVPEQSQPTEIETQGFWGEKKKVVGLGAAALAVAVAVIVLVAVFTGGGDSGTVTVESTFQRPVVEIIPVTSQAEKLEAIRSTAAQFEATKSYLDTIPTDHTLLEGKHSDASAPSEVRAASWVVLVDDENFVNDAFNVTRRFALAVLYYETNGENWLRSGNWLTLVSHCEWEGVVCAAEAVFSPVSFRSPVYEIVSLHLEVNNMAGKIPDALVFFQGLGDLMWTQNKLTGSLNEKIFRDLPLIQTMYLADNELTGEIPVMYNANETLDYLLLHGNNFTGTMPHDYCDHECGRCFWEVKKVDFLIDCDKVECTRPSCCIPSDVCG